MRSGAGWRRVIGAALAGLASVLVVVGTGALGGDRVADGAELADVALGWPVPWLHQDQRGLDPPLPYRAGPASPWDNATRVDAGSLLVDVLLVLAAGVVVGAAVRTAVGRRRPEAVPLAPAGAE